MMTRPGDAPPGPPGDLCEQLERPLRGAEVGQMELRIAIDDADHRHHRQVEPLRDHLRADEHVEISRASRRRKMLSCPPSSRRLS